MNRSLNQFSKFNKSGEGHPNAADPTRMIGEVNVILPPGFGLKKPSVEQLQVSSIIHNTTVDQTVHDRSIISAHDANG